MYVSGPLSLLLGHVWLFVTPWTIAHQAPQSLGFSRQEYCSGLPSPPPGDFPNPGIKPRSPALQADFFTIWTTRKAHKKFKTLWLKSVWTLHLGFLGDSWVRAKSLQLSDSSQPHGLPSSCVHGILQARILEWVAIPFSRGSSLG